MKISIKLGLVALVTANFAVSDPVITLFLKPYPVIPDECSGVSNKLKKPGKIAKHCLHGLIDQTLVAGIFASYAGYVTVSDMLGQIRFPIKQDKPIIKVLITDKIAPMFMAGNTIHHWEIEQGTPAALYRFERKQDSNTKLLFWEVEPADLPANNRFPTETLLLVAKPKNIYIPTGITVASQSPNFILPDIYIKKGIKTASHALYILNMLPFFRPIEPLYKKDPARYQQHAVD